MTIDRKEMLVNLKKVMPGVETGNSILDGADTFLFTEDGIYSYNDSIAVSIPVETGLNGAVKSKEFYNFLLKIKEDEIKVVQKKDNITLKCGNVTAKLKLVESSIAEYVENLDLENLKFKKMGKDFMEAMKLCKLNASNSPFRGLAVKNDVMYSTDEIRIASHQLKNKYDEFWIDDSIVNELMKLNITFSEICVGDGWAHFKSKGDSIFSCKTNDVSLYPFKGLIDRKLQVAKQDDSPAGKLPKDFSEAIDLVSVLSEDLTGFSVINLEFTASDLIVSAKRDTGSIKEFIPWEEPLEIDEDIQTAADAGFLMEASKKSFDFYITEIKGAKLIVFTKANFILVLSTIK